ncbi:unnamed protein product, partial [Vitis vinifera]
MLTIKTLTKA